MALSRLALVVVGGAAASAESAAAVATAAVPAASEVGDPAAPLIRMRTRVVRVAGRVASAVVGPASSAVVAGGWAGPGSRAVHLGGGGSLLAGGLLGGSLGDQVGLHPLSQLHCQLGVSCLRAMDGIAHPMSNHCVQDLVSCCPGLASQQIPGVDHGACGELDTDGLDGQILIAI
jgi:hypothetical protein